MVGAAPPMIPLRFQRLELQEKADLSSAGRTVVATAPGPREVIDMLAASDNYRDAVAALTLMLPRRQAAWWACLSARLVPDNALSAADTAAIAMAETWVQTQADEDSEQAGELAERCDTGSPARWAAMTAHWSGPSIAPRGQQAIPPAAHLAGTAARAALTLTIHHQSIQGRVDYSDLLAIGIDLMHGDLGRQVQAGLRARLATGAA